MKVVNNINKNHWVVRMKTKKRKNFVEMERKVFDIKNEPRPRGAWWWWFWLFFFNNPENPDKPRQLMILWSTKNVKRITCNDLEIELKHYKDKSNLAGAVASWYFDGEKMHHNFLLEQCNISVSGRKLSSDSATPTSFSVDKNRNTVKIGEDFEFVAEAGNRHDFAKTVHNSNNYIGGRGYSIIKLNHLDITGRVKNEPIRGSAYFQRVFVDVPSLPWYWGVFHFENGGILTYFNPRILGKSLKKDISFFDGEKMHEFDEMRIKKSGGDMPTFTISGENGHGKIKFTVSPYSHSSWTFRRKTLGIIPNKLVYNEYPAVISDMKLTDKKGGETITLEDLGKSVGNAEHTTGFLL